MKSYTSVNLIREHNDLLGLIGYCVKEDNVYSTNFPKEKREQAYKYYLNILSQKPKKGRKSQKQAILLSYDELHRLQHIGEAKYLFCLMC